MNYNDYERLYRSTMSRENKASSQEKSFKYLQKLAAVMRKTCKMITELYEEDQKQIIAEYSTSKASEMLADIQSKYMKTQMAMQEELKTSLDSVIESKRECIQKACKAPSTDDVNLLAVLNMRSKLSDNDIVHAAESVGDNLLALGTLRDIADRHGIPVPIPTAEEYERKLADAAEYTRSMFSEIFKPENELSYKGLEFYNYPDSEGYADMYFKELDNSVFTSEQKNMPAKINVEELKKALREKKGSGEKDHAESGSVAE